MLRKGQVVGVEKGDVLARTERLRHSAAFQKAVDNTQSVSQIFGVVA